MSNKYQRGVALEREVINLFREKGWSVIRGAGSKGEAFGIKADLLATKQTNENDKTAIMVIVQCKLKKRKE